jgi:hypothetical protein
MFDAIVIMKPSFPKNSWEIQLLLFERFAAAIPMTEHE